MEWTAIKLKTQWVNKQKWKVKLVNFTSAQMTSGKMLIVAGKPSSENKRKCA